MRDGRRIPFRGGRWLSTSDRRLTICAGRLSARSGRLPRPRRSTPSLTGARSAPDHHGGTALRTIRLAIGAIVAAAAAMALVFTSGNAHAATFGSSDRWATWTSGGSTIYNDVWGSGYGPQTIWANSYSNWGVWANHPNTGGIKSYPERDQVRRSGKVSAIGTVKSSFNVTVPTSGVAFEDGLRHLVVRQRPRDHAVDELVRRGRPAGHPADHRHRGRPHGGRSTRARTARNNVYSFLRTSNTSSGTVDVAAVAALDQVEGAGSATSPSATSSSATRSRRPGRQGLRHELLLGHQLNRAEPGTGRGGWAPRLNVFRP